MSRGINVGIDESIRKIGEMNTGKTAEMNTGKTGEKELALIDFQTFWDGYGNTNLDSTLATIYSVQGFFIIFHSFYQVFFLILFSLLSLFLSIPFFSQSLFSLDLFFLSISIFLLISFSRSLFLSLSLTLKMHKIYFLCR